MNHLCKSYIEYIQENLDRKLMDKVLIIFYGSNIYSETTSSDLDLCFFVPSKEIREQNFEKIAHLTKKFHQDNGLSIDEEVPSSNKLIYDYQEIKEALINPPFINSQGKYFINSIKKNSTFLSSNEMKQRLLIQILTTDKVIWGLDEMNIINNSEAKAWLLIINLIENLYNVSLDNIDEVLECLYTDKFTGASGEYHLGYKKGDFIKEEYLSKKLREIIFREK